MKIQVYGTGTSGHQMVSGKLSEALKAAGLDFSIENIQRVEKFMEDFIYSVPAIRLNHETVFEISSNGRFNASLRKAIQSILRSEDYGHMPKIVVSLDFESDFNPIFGFARSMAKALNGVLYVSDCSQNAPSTDVTQPSRLDVFADSINQDWIGDMVKEPFVETFHVSPEKLKALSENCNNKPVFFIESWTESLFSGLPFKADSNVLKSMNELKCPHFYIPENYQNTSVKNIFLPVAKNEIDTGLVKKMYDLSSKLSAGLTIGLFNKTDVPAVTKKIAGIFKEDQIPSSINIRACKENPKDLSKIIALNEGEEHQVIVLPKQFLSSNDQMILWGDMKKGKEFASSAVLYWP